ncbi:MAG TPA: hemerythrin domain-containing protein [Gammaproteobacteria bacterium]|nr:hemerythrin domain-containing protein [Gammaproteobacteria bacterium]
MLQQGAHAPDFTDPIGLLRACHGRVEHFAGLALRLADHPLEPVPAEPVQQAAGQVLRYFEQAAPLHHADEEQDLLPRLRARLPGPPAAELEALLAGLAAEHAALDARWAELRPFLEALRDGRPVSPDAYREAAAAFQAAQADHLGRENARILPAAEAHLTAADRAAMGAAMARRRGVGQNRDG